MAAATEPALPVLITYSNIGYVGFAKNLLLNLSATLKHHKVHFYCLDEEVMTALQALNITNIDITFELYTTSVSKSFESYGSAAYNKITHNKFSILRAALARYQLVHFIDCDVVCMKEPTAEYWAKYRDYDVVFQSDASYRVEDEARWPSYHRWACTGNTLFRNTPGTHRLIDTILEYQARFPGKNDQECLTEYFKQNVIDRLADTPIANLYGFPVQEFTNAFWVKTNMCDTSETYFFHANFAIGPAQKLKMLKMVGKIYI